ncbi:MAG TPA: prolipoprotein diacylglyceryl transferase family protein [Acidimicrobiales bacterium]
MHTDDARTAAPTGLLESRLKPIPVDFHIGSLQIHTYGIGLALTFWFALRYFERRLRNAGYPWRWMTQSFLWIVVASIVGARVVHVIANISYYSDNPGDILAIWHGGLSSFGGLLFAVPVGIVLARRRCPELPTLKALDLVAPVLVAAWAVGRLLGPQLMVNGGGHPTSAWYGLSYAGQVGKRIPVPVFQSLECFAILGILLLIERRTRGRPVGLLILAAVSLWSVTRFTDEFFWLAVPRLWDAVEVVSLILSAAGFVAVAVLWRRQRRIDAARPEDDAPEPGPSAEVPAAT